MPSATGSAPPESPVPAPRATKGMRSSLQIRTTACTSAASAGSATSAGTTRRPVSPSHSYVRSCSGSRIDVGRRREPLHDPRRQPHRLNLKHRRIAAWRFAHSSARPACRAGDLTTCPTRRTLPRRRAVPRRDPLDRRPALPRGGARGGRAARRARASRLAGLGRLHADGRRARRDGASSRAAARLEVSLFARPGAALGALRDGAGARRLRRRRARAGPARREPRGLPARRRARLPLGADRRPRRARAVRRGARRRACSRATCRRRCR